MKIRKKTKLLHFPVVPLAAATNSRNGKHRKIVLEIFSDLKKLDEHSAIKVDFAEAGLKKADLRSAVHRAAKKRNIDLVTTSDQKNLYIFPRPRQLN